MQFKDLRSALLWYAEVGRERDGAPLLSVAIWAALEGLGPDRNRVLAHVLQGRRLAVNDRRTRQGLRQLRARLAAEGVL